MIDGWTLTVERLTWDDREPDAYDILAGEVNDHASWVVRRYDTIVRTRTIWTTRPEDLPPGVPLELSAYVAEREDFMRQLALDGIVIDVEVDWRDYVLLAESLHARYVRAQDEALFPVWPALMRRAA